MIIPISYPLSIDSPLYPGTPTIKIRKDRSIDRGDAANTSTFSFSSHSGTHIDVPRHFCPSGKSVGDTLQSLNFFSPTYCLDLRLNGDECISPDRLHGLLKEKEDAVALLIRTGAGQLRKRDPLRYATIHPWIHPDVAALLRKACPHIRVVGIDTISISTPTYRKEGRESHRAFLCDDHPILLLEDVNLLNITITGSSTLSIIPWLIGDLDGVPVTAFLIDSSL